MDIGPKFAHNAGLHVASHTVMAGDINNTRTCFYGHNSIVSGCACCTNLQPEHSISLVHLSAIPTDGQMRKFSDFFEQFLARQTYSLT